MKIAVIQFNIAWEAKDENYKRAAYFLEKASNDNCDLIVFPEMFNTGFSMDPEKIGEINEGETDSILSNMAKQFRINLIAGYPLFDPKIKKGKNIAAVYNKEGIVIAKYSKIHPFSFAGEDKHYAGGENPIVFEIAGMPASLFICYDLRFPEIFRIVAKKIKAIFVIANWPSSRKEHWDTLLKARAIENQCYIIGVNRTGTDGNKLSYSGSSHVYDPFGLELCCGKDTEEYLLCEIDPNETDRIRAEYPFLKDMQDVTWNKSKK